MVFAYYRFSTGKQDEVQQAKALRDWAEPQGITIDEIIKDEGVSGGVSYKDRNLNLLLRKLKDRKRKMSSNSIPKEKDTVIVSELSRLGRAMGDISNLLNELKSLGVRLVIIKSGIDYDCSNLKAQDEFLFSAMAFAAQMEKELICSRTQSAIDARKEAIKKEGGFMSKTGNWCKKLGAKKGHKYGHVAGAAAGLKHSKDAANWRDGSDLYRLVVMDVARGKTFNQILEHAIQKYDEEPDKYCTRQGKPLCGGTLSRWLKEIRIGI